MTDADVGLLDTSVVIAYEAVDPALLPRSTAIAAITLAELAAGPLATSDPSERARRQDRLQWAASLWEPLPFDGDAARAYGRVYAATRAVGRNVRPRLADLLIGATALAHGLPVYTRNPANLEHLGDLLEVVRIP